MQSKRFPDYDEKGQNIGIMLSAIHRFFNLIPVVFFICSCTGGEIREKETVRVASFNIWEMSTTKITDVDENGVGQNEQLKAAATIIRKINPDILVINEIDHDIDALRDGNDLTLNARRFQDAYLRQDDTFKEYPYIFAAPCNTGLLSGKDLNNDGIVATPENAYSREYGDDSFGWGAYPGQYSMALLSRYPFMKENIRTFQKFLWKDLPDNLIPTDWYSPDEIEVLRLSSKSHWDIPVMIEKKTIHMLISHPTPPILDGPENRNGRRNYDEIRMWVHYIENDSVLVDDQGVRGGLPESESFIIAGDLNAAPHGDRLESGESSINLLLKHDRIQDCGDLLVSRGALNGHKPGPPKYRERRTAGWGNRGLRIDHLLPSTDLNVVGGGVYWPDMSIDAEEAAMTRKASDHRLIWLDISIK